MTTLEKLVQELLVLVSVLLWVFLRVAGVLVKKLEEGKPVSVELFGVEIVDINRKSRIRREREKILRREESDTQKIISRM
jgi:hypothetical protein